MARVIDLEAGRELQQHKRKDDRAAALKEALRSARTGSENADKARATRSLLNLYKRKNPPKTR